MFFRKLVAQRSGFTLIELMIFSAVFAIVMISFLSILVTVLGIQTRQSAVTEVTTQSNFLLQQIENYVERSSVIEMPQDTSTTTLKLRMPAIAEDPTIITLFGGTVYIQQAGGPQTPLTSGKVNVASLAFTKHSNPPGHDSVSVALLLAYNTPNLKQQFSEAFSTTVARASAATFDSNVIPSSTATYDLGVSSQIWRSVNNSIYFSGSNVGIGIIAPTQALQVAGGNLYVSGPGNGLIMKAPNGVSCYMVTITNGGSLTSTSTPC